MEHLKPGKKNKLKIGQKVQATLDFIDWKIRHLSWCYGVRVENDTSYGDNEKEIRIQDLPIIYALLSSFYTGEMPVGVVTEFGSIENGLKFVRVIFWFKTDCGLLKYETYVDEYQLVKYGKKKSKSKATKSK